MARKCATQVGNQENDPPGSIAEEPGKYDLETDTKKDDAKSPGIPADQAPDLRMFINNFLCSRLVGLTFHTPPKAVQPGHILCFEWVKLRLIFYTARRTGWLLWFVFRLFKYCPCGSFHEL